MPYLLIPLSHGGYFTRYDLNPSNVVRSKNREARHATKLSWKMGDMLQQGIDNRIVAPPRKDPETAAERHLWCEVMLRQLKDAMGLVTGYSPITVVKSERRQREALIRTARAWFRSRSDTFELICDAAGVDPDSVRQQVIPMIEAAEEAERTMSPREAVDAIMRRYGLDERGSSTRRKAGAAAAA